MTNIQLNANFNEVLEPLGRNAANFFLAASLYYAQDEHTLFKQLATETEKMQEGVDCSSHA